MVYLYITGSRGQPDLTDLLEMLMARLSQCLCDVVVSKDSS